MSQPPFICDVTVQSPNSVCLLTLGGTLDSLAAEDLRGEVAELRKFGYANYVFDLDLLKYIGSLGLQVLIGLRNELQGKGKICLCRATPNVRSVFTITRLDSVFPIYASVEDAMKIAGL